MQNIRAAVVCFCARIRCSVWFYVMKQSLCGTPVPVHQIICNLQPSCHTDMTITLSVVPLGQTAMFFNVCTLSVYSICILLQHLQEHAGLCLCVGSRWTVHPHCCCHLYYLRGCDMNVPQGMGTKEELCKPPPRPPRTSH